VSVSYDVRDGVAWLTIQRPEARNALNKAVRDGLFDGVRRFNDDESAKVLVLTGAGDKAFCAGGDLKEMSAEGLTIRRSTSSHSSAATSRWTNRRSPRSTG
jgi:enoyl-CoA hydratase/carnithine racemase